MGSGDDKEGPNESVMNVGKGVTELRRMEQECMDADVGTDGGWKSIMGKRPG